MKGLAAMMDGGLDRMPERLRIVKKDPLDLFTDKLHHELSIIFPYATVSYVEDIDDFVWTMTIDGPDDQPFTVQHKVSRTRLMGIGDAHDAVVHATRAVDAFKEAWDLYINGVDER